MRNLAFLWPFLPLVALTTVVATGPQVDLGYAIYEGDSLHAGVHQFLGMRYAAPPLGQNRFKRPEKPQVQRQVTQAKEHGAVCLGVQGLAFGSAPVPLSEDCLFIDVYAPANVTSADGRGHSVMLWMQGGAFVQLFNPNYNGTGLVEAGNGNIIVVTFNYRVGLYGFLASKELEGEGNLNIGLHDQRAAMSWVQDHIGQFGGDPDKVTLFGTSVGGGSVLLQTLAYAGTPPLEDTAKWRASIAEAPYMPPLHEVGDLEYQYDHLLRETNCTDLACLRTLDSATIQAANYGTPFPGQVEVPLFPYAPAIDGVLFNDTPTAMLKAGAFTRGKPLILGSSHSEGTIFVPKANTTEDIVAFLRTQYPDLTASEVTKMSSLYSEVPATFPGVQAPETPLYYHLAEMYGDVGFACPTLTFASALSRSGAQVYLFRDSILDPAEVQAGFIVPHTWEVQAVWGAEYAPQYVALPNATSYDTGGVNQATVSVVQRYWTAFAATGNEPNAYGLGAAPAWDGFEPSKPNRRLRLQTNATAMESVKKWELDRCAAWEKLSSRTHI